MLILKNHFKTDGVNYPATKAINRSAPGVKDGTEYIEALVNDWWGFFQAVLNMAGMSPNDVPESYLNSQILDAILLLVGGSVPKGYISGGVPSYVSGNELEFTSISARNDLNTHNIIGGVFNKTTAKPFVVGSGNAGLVSGSTNAWNIAGAEHEPAKDTPSGNTQPEGLLWMLSGTRLILCDNQNNQLVQYNPTIPYDASTKGAIAGTLDVSGQGTAPYDLTATGDALDLYILNDGGNDIDQYTMTTAGDLSTATHTGSFDVGGEEGNARGLDVNPDGTIMVIVGYAGIGIDQYSFVTSRDITTLSHVGFISTLAQDNHPESVRFGKNGTKLYILGNQFNSVFEYDLPTPYSPFIELKYTGKAFDIGNQDTDATGIFIKEDGLTLFMIGDATNNIYTYNMDTLFNMTLNFFAIYNTASSTYDIAIDSDPNGANVLLDAGVIAGGFTVKRRLSSHRTDSLGGIIDFTAFGLAGGGLDFDYKQMIVDYDAGNENHFLGKVRLGTYPAGIDITMKIWNHWIGGADARGLVSSLNEINSVVSSTNLNMKIYTTFDNMNPYFIKSNTAQYRIRTDQNANQTMVNLANGFTDERLS